MASGIMEMLMAKHETLNSATFLNISHSLTKCNPFFDLKKNLHAEVLNMHPTFDLSFSQP